MGQVVHRPMTADTINTILNTDSPHLNDREVASLYAQFNRVVKMRLEERNGVRITTSQKNEPITCYKNIGYYSGKVIVFRIGEDATPYVLFQHNNSKFKEIVELLKPHRKDSVALHKDGYECVRDTSELIIKLLTPMRNSLYAQFYWVLDVSNAVDCQGDIDLK